MSKLQMGSITHSKGVVTDPATEIEVNLDDVFSME